jgi:hypothetical protein
MRAEDRRGDCRTSGGVLEALRLGKFRLNPKIAESKVKTGGTALESRRLRLR